MSGYFWTAESAEVVLAKQVPKPLEPGCIEHAKKAQEKCIIAVQNVNIVKAMDSQHTLACAKAIQRKKDDDLETHATYKKSVDDAQRVLDKAIKAAQDAYKASENTALSARDKSLESREKKEQEDLTKRLLRDAEIKNKVEIHEKRCKLSEDERTVQNSTHVKNLEAWKTVDDDHAISSAARLAAVASSIAPLKPAPLAPELVKSAPAKPAPDKRPRSPSPEDVSRSTRSRIAASVAVVGRGPV
jgi:hypothetical protein